MPLLPPKPLSSISLLGLWQVEEPEEALREQLLSRRPGHEIPAFKALSRTREWLAARVLAYTLLDQLGAPPLSLHTQPTGEPACSVEGWEVSLTHSGPWVGALVSGSHRVGIDIEILGTKAPRLAPRFLTEEELAAVAEDPEKAHLYWSAKETLYKVYRHRKLDFQENLRLQDFERQPSGTFTGRICTESFDQNYDVHYEVHPAFVLTYVLASL
ncbi:4'-phosphopantetheinyl transferase superfamily protein [Rufibacter glacialis]|uniref:Enterobactin synthase component D n=1 Tax=Rufibacter glacialis TaxID=1259555 RepID=A0A5M8QHR8_9BACT|nr:4'-phosphopantetheinyl transferase superfamily protein [Rufibacter glacialis]KAA6435569.1 4'-phosphopantetheinyl transferase superfamily protein [Rufibacter glacialis]GGK64669.1 siderophore biosynthesis protein [Rufibacter glacialis]